MSKWEKYGFVIASKYRTLIVVSLAGDPKTPKELSIDTRLYISHVSSTLSELQHKEIVTCLTPNLRRGKLFALTEIGKEIASKLQERDSSRGNVDTNHSTEPDEMS